MLINHQCGTEVSTPSPDTAPFLTTLVLSSQLVVLIESQVCIGIVGVIPGVVCSCEVRVALQ